MNERFRKLVALLKELFQLDQPDLDFGIYRIMRARSAEVSRFLEKELLPQVKDAFAKYQSADGTALPKEREHVVQQARTPESTQKVRPLPNHLANEAISNLEAEVYDHLYRFFRRYYHEGDFISRRVYKEGVYAVPYEGEEVKLHWANHDQYYIKTAEHLRHYAFCLRADDPDRPMRVHFKLVDARQGEHDNIKETNKRLFVPAEDFVAFEEGSGGRELVLRFQYRPATLDDWPEAQRKGRKRPPSQKDLLDLAEQRLLGCGDPALADWIAALQQPHVKADGQRADYSRLRAHLNRYTARNTFDYFIHKNLGGFLRRELDFYIKNEVMHLDDIEDQDATRVEQYLGKIKVIRRIAHKIIDFLAQLEDFQKKLWLKKKFVTETFWCVSVGTILKLENEETRERLVAEIAANDGQREEWAHLLALGDIQGDLIASAGYSEPLTVDFLKAHPTLMVDTRHFPQEFTSRLLEALDDIDEQVDGVLVHGENFQALNLLRARYAESIKCIYIDPPYNSPSSEIPYKNDYKHASWLSLMHGRIQLTQGMLDDGVFVIAIDENEQERLGLLLEETWLGAYRKVCVAIRHNPRGIQGKNFSHCHEYAYFLYPSDAKKYIGDRQLEEADIRNLRDSGLESDRTDARNCFYPIIVKGDAILRFGEVPAEDFHPQGQNVQNPDGTVSVWPIDTSGREKKWRYSRQSVESIRDKLQVEKTRGKIEIYFAKDTGTVRTLWAEARFDASEYGTKLLQDMFGTRNLDFSYPKSIHTLVETLRIALPSSSPGEEYVLDFFAGSGTTGHAAIVLNREDGRRRKFVLVEMGDYFDTVLLPRLKKAAFAPEWKGGRPERMPTAEEAERGPRLFKIIRLESYEDTLNNLEPKRSAEIEDLFSHSQARQAGGFREQYLLRYMLDLETRGSASLLNLQAFTDPEHYRLKVKLPGSEESQETCIDLVETFNWLLGLAVRRMGALRRFSAEFRRDESAELPPDVPRRLLLREDIREDPQGRWWFRTVEGETRDGRSVLVIWRNRPGGEEPEGMEQDNLVLDAWFRNWSPCRKDVAWDFIYVNGTNNLENLKAPGDTWKVRLIEEQFHRLMFDMEEV